MACWSAENATKAYLKTIRMGQMGKEPNVAEFISALAAGNNAQLMVMACAGPATSTTLLALVAAAHQTGGSVICILSGIEELILSKKILGDDSRHINFVIGDAQGLLSTNYKDSEFMVIDCKIRNYEDVLRSIEASRRPNGNAIVLGYNAFCKKAWRCSGLKTQLLPIGEGLLITRINDGVRANRKVDNVGDQQRRKSNWVVKVDKCTGEEHVFRVRLPHRKVIQAYICFFIFA